MGSSTSTPPSQLHAHTTHMSMSMLTVSGSTRKMLMQLERPLDHSRSASTATSMPMLPVKTRSVQTTSSTWARTSTVQSMPSVPVMVSSTNSPKSNSAMSPEVLDSVSMLSEADTVKILSMPLSPNQRRTTSLSIKNSVSCHSVSKI